MDLKQIILPIQIISGTLAALLMIYWRLFTEEGKKFLRTKIKNLNFEPLDEEEKAVNISKFTDLKNVIKSGSNLLKVGLILWAFYFMSNFVMILYAIIY